VHPESGSLLHSSNLINVLPKHIAVFYLLNPLLILNCAARTTTTWKNLCLAGALLGLTRANRGLATLAISLAAYQSMYPIILVFPLAIHLATVEGIFFANFKFCYTQ
jgi:phosphatidylinositol glycan class U